MAENKKVTRSIYLLLLLILPFMGWAEGQDGLVIILDSVLFIFIFGVWAAIVFPTIKMINNTQSKK